MLKPKKNDLKKISLDIIEAQYALKNSRGKTNARALLVLIGGVEFSGKGQAIHQLRELMDPRYLYIKADIPQKYDQYQPFWLPYIADLPSYGQIMLFYGNWYTDLLASQFSNQQNYSEKQLSGMLLQISDFEQYLKNHGIDIIKVWFDISWEYCQEFVNDLNITKVLHKVPHFAWDNFPTTQWLNKHLFKEIDHIRKKFTADWIVINSEQPELRNYQFSQIILKALKAPIEIEHKSSSFDYQSAELYPELLFSSQEKMQKKHYQCLLKKLQKEIAEVLRYDSRKIILLFEGVDAAGKGGIIKRIIKYVSPYEYNIHCIAKPEDHEKHYPYLWRFYNKLSKKSAIHIFDRSWYGRVLVERVEELIEAQDWQSSFKEINQFEKILTDNNTVIIKFWLMISKEEQLKRFEMRENTPQKKFKITAEDWRNREKWDDYIQAASDMFFYTSTSYAPWHIIATDDKYTARIKILTRILLSLKQE
ncbi:polyphosphate--AMP phosphotransferase [Acinetobacter puyangensis]|uniref:Polyphosphate:AMP phosphotransferase n=1 Tax=Acinetobacter puyangensis TaxID=1096779 RepID=A0A240EBX6_9GAMM|nr:phosphate--AMP phosphotransferase [Acinetobacter puyangensis]SNX46204.1 Polyphosphate:AMP phosphotransferase [Acinetobacter puyangensis]